MPFPRRGRSRQAHLQRVLVEMKVRRCADEEEPLAQEAAALEDGVAPGEEPEEEPLVQPKAGP